MIPQPCGTVAAYRRHLYVNEQPDAACRQANNDYERARRHALGHKPYKMSECGTDAGHARHYYVGTVPCTACKQAHAEAKRNRRTDMNKRRRRGPWRMVIADYLETHGPMSIEELYLLIAERHDDVNLATLRKTVRVMKDNSTVEMHTDPAIPGWGRGIYSLLDATEGT